MLLVGYLLFFVLLIFYMKKLGYDKISKKKLLIGILLGFFSILIVVIISYFIGAEHGYDYETKWHYFLKVFVYAGLVEEIAKFIALIIYHPQKKDDFVVYALVIGIMFWISENIVYGFGNYGNYQWLNRLFHPGHVSYQVLMGILLYFAFIQKNRIFQLLYGGLSIFLPSVIHTLFNVLRGYINIFRSVDNLFPMSYIVVSIYIAIFEYFIIIMGIYIMKKKFGEQHEEN